MRLFSTDELEKDLLLHLIRTHPQEKIIREDCRRIIMQLRVQTEREIRQASEEDSQSVTHITIDQPFMIEKQNELLTNMVVASGSTKRIYESALQFLYKIMGDAIKTQPDHAIYIESIGTIKRINSNIYQIVFANRTLEKECQTM